PQGTQGNGRPFFGLPRGGGPLARNRRPVLVQSGRNSVSLFGRELAFRTYSDELFARAHLCGLHHRYPLGPSGDVLSQIERELALIEKLDFPGYFLAIWDVVRFARERGILCQGRGSAANSAVCYALQITAIDPVRMGLLFERFISMDRKEPPDID